MLVVGAFLIGAAAKLMLEYNWGWNLAMVSVTFYIAVGGS